MCLRMSSTGLSISNPTKSTRDSIEADYQKKVCQIPIYNGFYRFGELNGKQYWGTVANNCNVSDQGSCIRIAGNVDFIANILGECDPRAKNDPRFEVGSGHIVCPKEFFNEWNDISSRNYWHPGTAIGLGLAPKGINSKYPVLHRYSDCIEVFANAILIAWEHQVKRRVLLEMNGQINILKVVNNIEGSDGTYCDYEQINSIEYATHLDKLSNRYNDSTGKKWDQWTRAGIAVSRMTYGHIQKGLLPSCFYDICSEEMMLFCKTTRKVGNLFCHPLPRFDKIINGFLDVTGLDSSSFAIPQTIKDDFLNSLEEVFDDDLYAAEKRKARIEDTSRENRYRFVRQYASSIRSRIKTRGFRSSAISLSSIQNWIDSYGDILAEMILNFQNRNPGTYFHIDHIVPLASVSDEYAVDILSAVWHPANLQIVSESENLAKSSNLNSKRITQNNRTREDEISARRQLDIMMTEYAIKEEASTSILGNA